MHLSRNGFNTDDFYNTNDTDHVHFRWLHKVMKRVPRLSFSNLDSKTKYYNLVNYQGKRSSYGANIYQAEINGEDNNGQTVTSPINPYIDDQLDSHYQQVIKPQLDEINQHLTKIDQEINELNDAMKQTKANVQTNSDNIKNLNDQLSTVNAAVDKLKKG